MTPTVTFRTADSGHFMADIAVAGFEAFAEDVRRAAPAVQLRWRRDQRGIRISYPGNGYRRYVPRGPDRPDPDG
jgi:hypothetical protein